jgi:hypothetical protein
MIDPPKRRVERNSQIIELLGRINREKLAHDGAHLVDVRYHGQQPTSTRQRGATSRHERKRRAGRARARRPPQDPEQSMEFGFPTEFPTRSKCAVVGTTVLWAAGGPGNHSRKDDGEGLLLVSRRMPCRGWRRA